MWVFGLVDTSHTPAPGVMQVVAQRDAATLLPLIQQFTKPGTEVWSDEWSAYHNIGTLPNVSTHQTVNHSLHFKDPVTAVHSEDIELLEPGKDETEENEGLSPPPAAIVFR